MNLCKIKAGYYPLDEFKCDCCGACCRNIDKSVYFIAMDKGDGVCKYLNEDTNLCSIYEHRPLLCNVKEAYRMYFEKHMSIEEYYEENYKACILLKSMIK